MSNTMIVMTRQDVARRMGHIERGSFPIYGKAVASFLDIAATSTGRATFYASKAEQMEAERLGHDAIFQMDRGIYGLCLAFPGMLDRAKQVGVSALLSNPHGGASLLSLPEETAILSYLSQSLPIQRRLKMFCSWTGQRAEGGRRAGSVNNARARRLILHSILNDPDLEWHAVKYRGKMRQALTHALGLRRASIVRSIIEAGREREYTDKETDILYASLLSHQRPLTAGLYGPLMAKIAFVLGSKVVPEEGHNDLIRAYLRAPFDFNALSSLPPEVAEGFRATYHSGRSVAEVITATKERATDVQKARGQRAAEQKGVKLEFNLARLSSVQLYVYALERGKADETITAAAAEKGRKVGRNLPFHFGRVNIVLDSSRSMRGDHTQKWRPYASSLAAVDILDACSDSVKVFVPGLGSSDVDRVQFLRLPLEGHTQLHMAVLTALMADERGESADSVFILSDGYENAPAGRVAEIISHARRIGVDIPIYHLNPVHAAEVEGVRTFTPSVPVFPIGERPEALGAGLLRMMLESDFVGGVHALVASASKTLSEGKESKEVTEND